MNRELLEALGAVAADVYFDAMRRHPGLFAITGETRVTDEDRKIWPVLMCIVSTLLTVLVSPARPGDLWRASMLAA